MRTLSLITIFLLASLGFAQDCNNPLLDFYGLTGLSDPQSGSDLPYCSSLQNADTCCSADTVAGFQDKANDIIDKLNNYFAAKDLYLAQLRNSYLDRFNDMLEDINDDHSDDLREIRDGNATIADQLQTDIDESNRLRTEARDINRDFVRALDEYQRARSDCFDTALQVQASAWCLACDPNYATEGVNDDGSVTFSDGLCQAISDACWPFFNQSAKFNPLINARAAYWRLSAVSRYLNDYSDNEQIVPFNVSEDPYNPLASQQSVEVPDEWIGSPEEAGNSGQCSDLWAGDDLLAELLTIGAPGSAADDNGNNQDNGDDTVVVVDPNPNARLLQDALAEDEGIWAPELDGTGLDFGSLRNDPGTFFGASDYSDYFNQTQSNGNDNTDRTDNDDHTDNDIWDRTDSN